MKRVQGIQEFLCYDSTTVCGQSRGEVTSTELQKARRLARKANSLQGGPIQPSPQSKHKKSQSPIEDLQSRTIKKPKRIDLSVGSEHGKTMVKSGLKNAEFGHASSTAELNQIEMVCTNPQNAPIAKAHLSSDVFKKLPSSEQAPEMRSDALPHQHSSFFMPPADVVQKALQEGENQAKAKASYMDVVCAKSAFRSIKPASRVRATLRSQEEVYRSDDVSVDGSAASRDFMQPFSSNFHRNAPAALLPQQYENFANAPAPSLPSLPPQLYQTSLAAPCPRGELSLLAASSLAVVVTVPAMPALASSSQLFLGHTTITPQIQMIPTHQYPVIYHLTHGLLR